MASGQSTRSCTYTLFLEIELIFALRAAVSEIARQFSKLPYLGMKLGMWPTWPKFQKLHIHPISTQGSKLRLFLLYGQRFPTYGPIFKTAIFGYQTCPLAKVPEVAHIYSLYLRGSKLSLFSLYRQRFPRYGPLFKIAIFWHETWPLKIPEVAHIPSFHW